MIFKKLKLRGITRRWIINSLGVIVIVLLIIEIAFAFYIKNFYYTAVRNGIYDQISKTAPNLATYLSGDTTRFENGAREIIESFDNKELVEMMVINKYGKVLVTTSGFLPSSEPMPDYKETVQSGKTSMWIGNLTTGEKVLAVTTAFKNSATGELIGSIRYIVSLSPADRQITIYILISFSIALAIIFFVVISGVYFINSIVRPVREVGQSARLIAMGDFDVRIERRYNDEIGDLCDTINYMAGELGSAEKMKNDFISSVSHELRTPLTAIKGWGETLKAVGPENEQTFKKGMDVIINESERLSGIVDELLDFSRIQSGRLKIMFNKIDLLAELEEVIFIFMERSKRDGITLTFNEPENISPIIGDGNRLRQVFINILDNAFKYSNPGGHVTVTIAEINDKAVVTVKDEGIGISEEDLPKIKEKFYKADQTRRGSGIGLAIADEIIRLHSGTIEITSKVNIGTTVVISLPVYKEQF